MNGLVADGVRSVPADRRRLSAAAERNGAASVPADSIAIKIVDIWVVVPPDFDSAQLSRNLVCVRAAP